MALKRYFKIGNHIVMIPKRIALMILKEYTENAYCLYRETQDRQVKLLLNRIECDIDWNTFKMILDETVWLKLRLLGKVPFI